MKNKKNDKLIDNTLIIIIILLIIVTIINIIVFNKKDNLNENTEFVQSHSNQVNNEEIDKYLTVPTYMLYVFKDYKGDYSQNNIVKAINKLSGELIPKFCKEVDMKNKSNIKKYFEEQKFIQNGKASNIQETNIAIENEKAFEKLIESIKNVKIREYSFDYSLKIEKDSIQITDEGIKTSLDIQYEQNEMFSIDILVKNNDDNGVVIEICE